MLSEVWELVHKGEGQYKKTWEIPPTFVCKACRKDKPDHHKDCPIAALEAALKDAEERLLSATSNSVQMGIALETSEKREAGLREALQTAYKAIASLDINIFGSGNDGEIQWPIRDELLDKLAKALKEPAEDGDETA